MQRDPQTLARQDFNYIVIDAALLFEVKLDKLCDCTVTVDAPIDQCIERVKKRNHLTETQIRQRMRFQLSFQEKRARADYVLVNDAALEILHEKIKKLNDWILHFC
ncbi:MAG: dephospho-CoA kinase [candidate division KSB1 bacterium]|nr:dephospho-CoA kinase [candidate division KSB1 bacterium]